MSDIALPPAGVSELRLGGRLLGDERLAKLAGRGSERAFAALYERHHQALYRYCRSIVGNDQDAQDALQSAMMRAYAALRSYERELAVKPWLFRIAHNEAISLLRKRRPELDLAQQETALQAEASPQDTLERRERLSALVADLRSLPDRQRAVLLMRELSGLSIAQIAQAMEISSGAAKQTLFEARSSLHELAEGRAMECESVRQAISQRDGRVLRGRRIRAHLRACEQCRDFRAAIRTRSSDLAAIAPPLPASLASALLARLLLSSSRQAPTAGAGSGAIAGGHAAASSLLGKSIAGAAVLAAAAGTAHFATTHRSHRTTSPATGAASPAMGAGISRQAHAGIAVTDAPGATGQARPRGRSAGAVPGGNATPSGVRAGAGSASSAGAVHAQTSSAGTSSAAAARGSAARGPAASAHSRSTTATPHVNQRRSNHPSSYPRAANRGTRPSSPHRQAGGSPAQHAGSSHAQHSGSSHGRQGGSSHGRHGGSSHGRQQHGSTASSASEQPSKETPAARSGQPSDAAPAASGQHPVGSGSRAR